MKGKEREKERKRKEESREWRKGEERGRWEENGRKEKGVGRIQFLQQQQQFISNLSLLNNFLMTFTFVNLLCTEMFNKFTRYINCMLFIFSMIHTCAHRLQFHQIRNRT